MYKRQHHFGTPILPPIAPIHCESTHAKETFVLVYLPFESRTEITKLLKRFPDQKFVIYHPDAEPKKIKNLDWRKPSRHQFPEDLAACDGVICNAGFELASETLQLGKKILVKPMSKQVEQHSNALALESLGWGRAMMNLSPAIVEDWLSDTQAVTLKYPDTAAIVADYIAQGAKGNIEQLVNKLWSQTMLPSNGKDQSYRPQTSRNIAA